jgi:hypothetical protein
LVFVVLMATSNTRAQSNLASEPGDRRSGREPANHNSSTALNDTSLIWRSERVCGLNCVYLLLKRFDRDVDYKVLESELVKNDLASLADLKRGATVRGLTMTVARTDRHGLATLSKPLIAHLDLVSPQGEASGHFVLVTGTDPKAGVTCIDGTTAEPRTISWSDFERDWSGYVLAHDTTRGSSPETGILAAGLGLFFGYLLFRLSRHLPSFPRRISSKSHGKLGRSVVSTLCLSVLNAAALHAADVPSLEAIGRVYQARETGIHTVDATYHITLTPLLDSTAYYKATRSFEALPSDLTIAISDDGRKYFSLTSEEHQIGDVIKALTKKKGRAKPIDPDQLSYQEVTAASRTFKPTPFRILRVFDGEKLWELGLSKILQNGIAHSTYEIIHIPRLRTTYFAPTPLDWGFWSFRLPSIPKDDEQVRKSRLPDKFQTDKFVVSQAIELVGGDECIAITTPTRETHWLMREKGYTVRKSEYYIEEQKAFGVEFSDWRPVNEQAWIANKVVTTSYGIKNYCPAGFEGKALDRASYVLTRLEINSPSTEALFHVEPSAGDLVSDENIVSGDRLGQATPIKGGGEMLEAVSFQTPANREDLDRVIQAAVDSEREKNPTSWARSPAFWLVVMAVAGIAVYGASLYLRRK